MAAPLSRRRRGDRRRMGGENRRDQTRLALAFERLATGRHLVRSACRTRRCRCARPRPFLRAAPAPCIGSVPRIVPSAVSLRWSNDSVDIDAAASSAGTPRQAEVEELRARRRQHHVARLQIAMHDPLTVRMIERARDLRRRSARRRRPAGRRGSAGRPAFRLRDIPSRGRRGRPVRRRRTACRCADG